MFGPKAFFPHFYFSAISAFFPHFPLFSHFLSEIGIFWWLNWNIRARAEKEAEYRRNQLAAVQEADRDAQTALQLRILAARQSASQSGTKDVVINNFSLPAFGGGTDLLFDASLRFAQGRR